MYIHTELSYLMSIADKWKFPTSVPATGTRMCPRETRHRGRGSGVYAGENRLAIKPLYCESVFIAHINKTHLRAKLNRTVYQLWRYSRYNLN